MSKIIISFIDQKGVPKDPNRLFGILDLETENLEWVNLSHLLNTDNFVHGMGMCYNDIYFCAAIIPVRKRLASNLLTINLKTGEKKISYLYFSKAIHGLISIDKNRLLATSTQTDIISELIIENGWIINEDVFEHFVPHKKWSELKVIITKKGKKSIDYRALSKKNRVDDQYHVNSIYKNKNHLYCTMFFSFLNQWNGKDYKGILYNMTTKELILNNLDQPHTVFIDSKENICCCNSSQFTFIVKDKFEVKLLGYTRGICEDPEKGGYWIGISAYRRYHARIEKWVEKYPGKKPLKGARIQFISYKGEVGSTIELAQHGKEIFDLYKFKEGKWNT